MRTQRSIDEFWGSVPPSRPAISAARLTALPDPARRYLEHAIAHGTPLGSVLRLRMHGEIKLQRWLPFTAEQVIRWDRGLIWSATIRMSGLPIRGFDRFLDGEGVMQWKLLNVWPLMRGSGPDITRSAAGRLQAESVWLPSVLAGDQVSWTATGPLNAQAHFTV